MLIPIGGAMLAGIAGYVNVVLIEVGHGAVTHLTGTVSLLSADVGRGDPDGIGHLAAIVACFLLGAVLSGVIIGRPSLRLGRPYGLAMLLEAALLALAAGVLERSADAGIMLAATAAGLQNAMASSYGNQIVRTTHITGVVTDLGFHLGRALRHREIEGWRVGLLLAILLPFFAGGIAGHAAGQALGGDALWIPTALLALGGGSYLLLRVGGRR